MLESALDAAVPNPVFCKELCRRVERYNSPVLEDGIMAAVSEAFVSRQGKKSLTALLILEALCLKFPERMAQRLAQKTFQDSFLALFNRVPRSPAQEHRW